jgi:1,5-anhydro-D-fructose reductase (1,5-anhydro-D-mannitol-forming)
VKGEIRYGIIGFGRFAEKSIAPAIQASPNSSLVAIQKRSREMAEEKARGLGVPLAFDSVEALVAHPAVDAVFIVSANSAHCSETLAAARAGKHVLVEKPMAMDAGEAETMIGVAALSGVKLMVGHMLRLSPLVGRIREIVQGGAVGKAVYARADFIYDARLSTRQWLLDRRIAGGGPVFDVGVHCLDTLRYVLNDEVVDVQSQLEPLPTAETTESAAQLQLKFSKGTIGSIYCSYVSSLRKTLIEIQGTEATLSAPNFTTGSRTLELTLVRGESDKPGKVDVEKIAVPNLYIEEITHFSDCILKDREPFLSGSNGLANQRVLDLAMKVHPLP